MNLIQVYSHIHDPKISDHLNDSPIWENAMDSEKGRDQDRILYCYSIKFDGTKPIQVTNITSL